jgi:hypothetical protein
MITLENGSTQHPCAFATYSDASNTDSAGGGQTCIPNPVYPKFPENEVVAADSAFVDNTAERTMDACVSNCALVATVSSRF